ncbi:MAG: hypothetical protein KDD89_05295 [Anaerolineales bacterium]|nr:hypothetical protein [Anaerolineales bacterium]
MSLAEERLEILKMIESGKITAVEGATLIQALNQTSNDPDTKPFGTTPPNQNTNTPEARWLRVTVTDPQTGDARVKLNIPIGLVNTGLRMGARFVPNLNQSEYKEFMSRMEEMSRTRQSGPVVDTVTESGEHLTVYIE